jgi:hypothetical protein
MPRLAALALAVAAAVAASGCGTSACQELGERICSCQPGMNEDTCQAQVEEQLNTLGVDTPGFGPLLDNLEAGEPLTFEDRCEATLATCEAVPADALFCEWLLTNAGKVACGLTPEDPDAP